MTTSLKLWQNHKNNWLVLGLVLGLATYLSMQPLVTPEFQASIKAKGAVTSLADHLGFALGFAEVGTPGFPNPFQRHDPQKKNYRETNGKHIRNALRGIEQNLARNQTLRDYFRQALNEKQYQGLTEALDKLVKQLKNPHSEMSQAFGENVSAEILEILERTKYIQP